MPWSPKSVFSFPDWIPPFRHHQVAQLCIALRVRRDSPNVRNTWRVREVIAELFRLPVHTEEVWDICTQFFAAGYVNSLQVSRLLDELREAENDPDRQYITLTPGDD